MAVRPSPFLRSPNGRGDAAGWRSAVLGWSLMTGIVFGLCLSTASTVVLLRARRTAIGDGQRGQIAIGWLIVEDT